MKLVTGIIFLKLGMTEYWIIIFAKSVEYDLKFALVKRIEKKISNMGKIEEYSKINNEKDSQKIESLFRLREVK